MQEVICTVSNTFHKQNKNKNLLGRNMAWLLKMKEATASKIEPPKKEKKEYTNFIR